MNDLSLFSIEPFFDIYNDILISIDKAKNKKPLSVYEYFLLDNISLFTFSLRTCNRVLDKYNNKELKK